MGTGRPAEGIAPGSCGGRAKRASSLALTQGNPARSARSHRDTLSELSPVRGLPRARYPLRVGDPLGGWRVEQKFAKGSRYYRRTRDTFRYGVDL